MPKGNFTFDKENVITTYKARPGIKTYIWRCRCERGYEMKGGYSTEDASNKLKLERVYCVIDDSIMCVPQSKKKTVDEIGRFIDRFLKGEENIIN